MKTVTGLLPITIGVVLVGVLAWYLLQRGMTVGTWLLAAVLFGHGWVHLVFAFPSPAPEERTSGVDYPFDMSQSWLIGRGLAEGTVRTAGLVLMALTVLGFTLATAAERRASADFRASRHPIGVRAFTSPPPAPPVSRCTPPRRRHMRRSTALHRISRCGRPCHAA